MDSPAQTRIELTAAALTGLWLLPSIGALDRYLGASGLVVAAVVAFFLIHRLLTMTRNGRLEPATTWFVALWLVATLLFVVLYPLANNGTFGPGSDRDDALNVALHAGLSGRFPYADNTYLGNPPTPMPGALLLALPFYLLGNAAWQNPVWLGAFVWWCARFFQTRSVAWLAILLFILACPASLLDFVVGGDYLVNALYVLIASDMALCAQVSSSRGRRLATYLVLAVAIASRPIYAVAAVAVVGSAFRRGGLARASEAALVTAAIAAVMTVPFYFHDPDRFPTRHLLEKLDGMPFASLASVLLPALALALAAAAFLVSLRRHHVIGLIAISLGVMLYPPTLFDLALGDMSPAALSVTGAVLPVSLFAAIAVLRQFESGLPQSPLADCGVTSR